MTDVLVALALLATLGLSFAAGRLVHRSLAEAHRGAETTDFVRSSASLLVTLTAIVLGLLLTTVNGSFNKTGDDLRRYAATTVLLDRDLDTLGPPMAAARATLQRYVASAIASTWPDEPPPRGAEPVGGTDIDNPALGDMLYGVQAALRGYAAPDPGAARVQSSALERASAMLGERQDLIGEAHNAITPQFLALVTVWLALLFMAFGLIAPRNRVGLGASAFVALSIAGAVFLALELDGPLDGLVVVSSQPMRYALAHIERAQGAAAQGARR